MYTPDEKRQLEQLENMSTSKLKETNIKEVGGGYIISHRVSYLDGDTVLATVSNQFVTADQIGVREAIASLYPDSEFEPAPADYVTSPPDDCPLEEMHKEGRDRLREHNQNDARGTTVGSVPETERYDN